MLVPCKMEKYTHEMVQSLRATLSPDLQHLQNPLRP